MRVSRDIEYSLISHKVDFMIYLLIQGGWCVSALCLMPSSRLFLFCLCYVYYVVQLTSHVFMVCLVWAMVYPWVMTTWPSFPYWNWNNVRNEFVVPNSCDDNGWCGRHGIVHVLCTIAESCHFVKCVISIYVY